MERARRAPPPPRAAEAGPPDRRGRAVSREGLWERVRRAWAKLGAGTLHDDVRPGRPRAAPSPPRDDDPELPKEGFAEEAIPWLDAVYRFSLRLTQGDEDAADDLVQETFMRAYRAWHTFERGTNARSWLFTICRNTFLKGRERLSSQREVPAASFEEPVDERASVPAFGEAARDPERVFFEGTLDDEVVRAIDALSEPFREVLVLSDLGDLTYDEIAEVLELPLGTVKSRLFRARRALQERLVEFAREAGYVSNGAPAGGEEP